MLLQGDLAFVFCAVDLQVNVYESASVFFFFFNFKKFN